MANEFTLADYEAIAPDNLNKAVIRTWREASPIMDMLPWKTDPALSMKYNRWTTLPTVPWRKVSEAFSDVKVTPSPTEERLFFMGAKIDYPYEYEKAPSIINERANQAEAIIRGAAFAFNEAFILGDPGSNPDSLIGLHYRLFQDLPSTQRFSAGGFDCSIDTAVATWWQGMFDRVEDLLSRVDGNPGDKALWMGKTLYNRFQSACRQSNLLDTTVDQLGRQFITYGKGGPKIMDVGYKVDQSTPILGDVENANGIDLSGGATSSMYCTRFGEPYLAGWAQEKPNAEDVGLLESRTHYRTVVRFSPGLYIVNPRAAAVAYNWVAA